MRIDRVKLAAEMARRDMRIKDLCERSGVSHATITAIKSGKACLRETAQKIAAGIGVSLSDLLSGEGL